MSRLRALALLAGGVQPTGRQPTGMLAAGVLAAGMLAAGVLAGCSSPPPPTDTARQRCEWQADKNPAVQKVLQQQALRSGDPAWQEELALARRKAVDACLVAAGVALRGGVQPVSRARYGLGWY